MLTKKLYLQTLGGLKLNYSDSEKKGTSETVIFSDFTSPKMWSMLTYLMVNRKSKLTTDRLVEVLWAGKEISDSSNSIKALLFKLRKVFETLGIENAREFIINKSGTFIFSDDISIQTDIDEFDSLSKYVFGENDLDYSSLTDKCFDIYKGDFLPELSSQFWTDSVRIFYHNQFVSISCELINNLYLEKKTGKALSACRTVLKIDPYDEEINRLYIISLVKAGKAQTALEHYKFLKKLYIENMGEEPSEVISKTYKIINEALLPQSSDLSSIKDELLEQNYKGAFYCEYAIFREIFRVEQRSVSRISGQIYLGVITIKNYTNVDLPTTKRAAEIIKLQEQIALTLRVGDVFTKINNDKFLLLLVRIEKNQLEAIMQRIAKNYKSHYPNSRLILSLNTIDYEDL